MKKANVRILFSMTLLLFSTYGMKAQSDEESVKKKTESVWSVGFGGSLRVGGMRISKLDESIFPKRKPITSGTFSIFVLGEFGKEYQYAVRPQLSIAHRGGRLTQIMKDTYGVYNATLAVGDPMLTDINYRIRATYIDVRVPLIYQFLKSNSAIRPYVMLEPRLGFASCGDIRLRSEYDNVYESVGVKASKANLSAIDFGAALGAGVRFNLPMAGDRISIGVEASYELGLSNTYGSKEKDGKATDISGAFAPMNYELNGKRRFNGFELGAVVGVPFSMFKKRAPRPEPLLEPKPVVVVEKPQPVKVEAKPCYTIEEISALIDKGESVEGKTICAINAINFDFGISKIKPESYSYLNSMADFLNRTGVSVTVKGHTDNVGSDDFNMKLSKNRAQAVVDYLASKGVPRNRLSYQYFGSSKPLTSNDTEEGRALNRRVEFELSTK